MLLFTPHPGIRKEHKILVSPYNYNVLIIINPKKCHSIFQVYIYQNNQVP